MMKKTNKSQPEAKLRKTPWQKTLHRVRESWQLYVFLLLPMFFLFIFNYVPMWGARIAFQDYRITNPNPEWVGLRWFRQFFHSYEFWQLIRNTLRISVYYLVTNSVLSITFALLIHAIPNKGFKRTVQSITCLPHFISVVVVVGIMLQVFNPAVGLYGNLHRIFGGAGYPKDILGQAKNFNHFYNWSTVWQELGWSTIIYLSVLTTVNPNLHEAAMLDGASRFKRMLYLDLPTVLPIFSINLIMSCGNLLTVGLEKILLLQNSTNTMYSQVLSSYVYNIGLGGGMGAAAQFSLGSAVGLFTNVVNLILLFTVNRIAKHTGVESL